MILEEDDDLEFVMEYFEWVVEISFGFVFVWWNLGLCYVCLGCIEEVIECMWLVVEVVFGDFDLYMWFGVVY